MARQCAVGALTIAIAAMAPAQAAHSLQPRSGRSLTFFPSWWPFGDSAADDHNADGDSSAGATLVPEGQRGNEGNEGDEGDEGRGTGGVVFSHTVTRGGGTAIAFGSTRSVTCTTTSESAQFSSSQSVVIDAVAEAVATVCNLSDQPLNGELFAAAVNDAWVDADAYAIAEAIAETSIKCKTQGRGRACASAQASAESFASATATAYADAFARAVDLCDCAARGEVPDAVGSADYFREFVVAAAAAVDTNMCIEGDAEIDLETQAYCLDAVLAQTFAKAMANAFVTTDCVRADAKASVSVLAGAEINEIKQCS